jgi:hypothetical protein
VAVVTSTFDISALKSPTIGVTVFMIRPFAVPRFHCRNVNLQIVNGQVLNGIRLVSKNYAW